MWRHRSCLAFGILLAAMVQVGAGAGFNPNTDPSLVGYWKLDDGSGTVAVDSSPGGHNGTFSGDPEWVTGWLGGALEFDGDDYVDTGFTDNLATWTISAWVTSPAAPAAVSPSGPVHRENNYQFNWNHTDGNFQAAAAVNAGGWYAASYGPLEANTWYFLTGTYDGQDLKAYRNGVLISTNSSPSGAPAGESNSLKFARHAANAQFFTGAVDDVRVYNRALTVEEILAVLEGGVEPGAATGPAPDDKATDVLRDVTLSWTPGQFAQTHDVYLGTSFDDVNAATASNPLNVLVSQGQSGTSFDPGRLELGQTYYWKIDEVNAAPDLTVYKGTVWSFTVEPYSYPVAGVIATASSASPGMGSEKTVDGSGLSDDKHSTTSTDTWVTAKGTKLPAWIQYEFPSLQKLDRMLVWNSNQTLESILGLSAKGVKVEYSSDGQVWTALGDFEFAPAPGSEDCTADTVVDFGGVAAKFVKLTISSNWGGLLSQSGLSEVRILAIPVAAREPQPAPDATDVNPQVNFTWRAGREAASHKVFVSDDQQAVLDGTASPATVSVPEYETALMLDKTYYWKVAEVNTAEAISTWDSDVWSFSTGSFVAVDDFEAYTDDMDAGETIFQTWTDGWDDPANGSIVGYGEAPFAEQTVVSSGRQSMPLAYENTGSAAYSEAKWTFETAQDWTKHGVTTLVVYFRGQASNTPAKLYLKINDTKIAFNNGAASTAIPLWKQWNIDLAAAGASLKSVKSLTIGVEGSGTGLLFIDDIRLYGVAPVVIGAIDPGTSGLVALYAMEGNVEDTSGKKYNGTANGLASYDSGYAGQALVFNGTNTYVDLPLGTLMTSLSDVTIASHVNFGGGTGSWQRIFDFGTGNTNYMFLSPRQGTGGAMRFAIRTATVTEQIVDSPAAMPTGWHHTAVTIDSKTMTMKLYLDGAQVGEAATTLLPKDLGSTTQNWLGRSQWTADAYFLGSLDEFRMYNRVLSASEVRYLAGDR